MRFGDARRDVTGVTLAGFLLLGCFFGAVCAIYLPPVNDTGLKQTRNQQQPRPKTNSYEDSHRAGKSSVFKNDKEIERYLMAYGQELMLWRCKNAIQPHWTDRNPLPFVELYCEVIGRMKKVQWYYNKKPIKPASGIKYRQTVLPHLERGQYYSRWIDFRLRVYNATWRDTGVYVFSATSPGGQTAKQTIYLDISEKKKKKKKKRKKKKRASDLDYDLDLAKRHEN